MRISRCCLEVMLRDWKEGSIASQVLFSSAGEFTPDPWIQSATTTLKDLLPLFTQSITRYTCINGKDCKVINTVLKVQNWMKWQVIVRLRLITLDKYFWISDSCWINLSKAIDFSSWNASYRWGVARSVTRLLACKQKNKTSRRPPASPPSSPHPKRKCGKSCCIINLNLINRRPQSL